MPAAEHPRITALREFCERQGFDCNVWTGTQREPGDGVSITVRGVRLRVESHDGLLTAVGRIELSLELLGGAGRDVYLVEKHREWGWPG